MQRKKNILVCPLDWGLGHATRMVPIINALEKQGANAILAADNRPLDFLKQYYPNNTILKLEGYSPTYPINGSMAWALIKSAPSMIKKTKKAKIDLNKIINEYNIDAIISDNRYELSSKLIPSVFITHQLNIQTSGLQTLAKPIIDLKLNSYIDNFDEVWIPDNSEKDNLSGILSKSQKFSNKSFHIGLLSRFSSLRGITNKNSIDLMIILSGPEPQRTILEEKLIKQASKTKLKTVVLLGKPEESESKELDNIMLIPHADDINFASLLASAKYVICRPGYSTLMDLAILGTKAILIPTPGQTEQEYLASKLKKDKIAFSQNQKEFNLLKAIQSQDEYRGFSQKNESDILNNRIHNLLNNC